MARRKPIGRKRRTRQHVIADLSANRVEKQALLCGFAVRRVAQDYGIDLQIATFDETGQFENGEIAVQLKATDRPRLVHHGQFFAVRIAQEDFRHWLMEPMPVIVALYDAANDAACWVYIQAYFETRRGLDFDKAGATVTVHIPRTNVVDPAAMWKFREYRDKVLVQLEGLSHDD